MLQAAYNKSESSDLLEIDYGYPPVRQRKALTLATVCVLI